MAIADEKTVKEAKEYVKSRLSAEQSMSSNLEAALEKAVRLIVAISIEYGVPPSRFKFSYNAKMKREIEAVIDELKETIEDYIFTLAVAGDGDDDEILAYIKGEIYGDTLDNRLDGYLDRFKDENEAAIAAGLLLGESEDDIADSIISSKDSPYQNPMILKTGSEVTGRLGTKTSFGKGQRKGSWGAIDTLSTSTIAVGWMHGFYTAKLKANAIGFLVYRGSSYPCDICDSNTGFHSSTLDLPPYHPHCVCYAVPVYAGI